MTRLAIVVALLALPAAADARTRQFRMPSNNIGCLWPSSGGPGPFIPCDVLSEGDNGGFYLKRRGKARRRHITDTVFDNNAPVLRYGRSRRFGRYTCNSRRNGHGFS